MIKLKIQETVYEIPNSWEDVSIKKYMEVQNVLKEEATEINRIVNFISILSNCPKELLRQISITDLTKIDLDWISKQIKPQVKKIIEIDGKKYGVVKDMKNLTLGEYADLDTYTQKLESNFHYIAAILMRPVIQEDGELFMIEKYDGKIEERAQLFLEHMNVVQLYTLADFFLLSANGYLKSFQHSSTSQKEVKVKEQKTKKMKDLVDGGGAAPSLNYVEKTSQK